jgi:putative nucleotidyltransferase with HDIG domain
MHDTTSCSCHGPNSAQGNGKEYKDNKHILVVVDGNAEHRAQIRGALGSLYNIIEFENASSVMDYLHKTRPGIVVVADDAAPKGGYDLVAKIRLDRKLRTLPVMMMLSSDHPDKMVAARECGASAWLAKPYKRSMLIKVISGRLNAAVERQWGELPPLQAQALKGTVEMFNSLSDVIDRGEPIIYGEISQACGSLVEAVGSDNFKGILSGVRNHDNYTYAHSLRVAVFLSLFGKTIGLPESDQKILATGGLLHDVGKMLIPHLVLNKPGRLTDDEFAVMKGHVNASVRILEAGDNIPRGVILIAAQHHEKLDGTGYPNGLKGTELNELARMASIVDVFSALTDRRVYKAPMAPEQALAIMSGEMANHLDMDLLERFSQMLLDAVTDIE